MSLYNNLLNQFNLNISDILAIDVKQNNNSTPEALIQGKLGSSWVLAIFSQRSSLIQVQLYPCELFLGRLFIGMNDSHRINKAREMSTRHEFNCVVWLRNIKETFSAHKLIYRYIAHYIKNWVWGRLKMSENLVSGSNQHNSSQLISHVRELEKVLKSRPHFHPHHWLPV